MTTYLAEWYAPKEQHEGFASVARRLADAVGEVTSGAIPLRYLGAVLSRADETAFCLLEGPSAESLPEVAHRAGLRFDRIGEALYVPARGDPHGGNGMHARSEGSSDRPESRDGTRGQPNGDTV